MTNKHIGHLITVSLKIFFNIDDCVINNAFASGLMAIDFVKLFGCQVGAIIYNEILSVKQDVHTIKAYAAQYIARQGVNKLHEALIKHANKMIWDRQAS